MKKTVETYKVEQRCANCGWQGQIEFPLGVEVYSKSCPECECNSLTKFIKLNEYD